MTKEEVLAIRKYAEGAYPQMKSEQGFDAVWFDILADYSFNGIMQSLKERIKSGNKYPPSIAELIGGYKDIITAHDALFVKWLESTGYFDDSNEDVEIAQMNKRHRREKTETFLQRPDIMPEWLKAKLDEYHGKVERRLFKTNEIKQIEGK